MQESGTVALSHVTVRFGRTVVLDDISMTFGAGELIGVRGSNGAGKTTLLRLLVNAYRPNSGVRRGPRRSAYVPAVIEPPPLSAQSWLIGVPRPGRRPGRTDPFEALEALGFDGDLNDSCRALSLGNLRKLLLAEAFTCGERLVVIDEASAGLDDVGLAGLRFLVDETRASARTLVLADQDSRPFPVGTSVFRIAGGTVRPASTDGDTAIIALRGPSTSKQTLLARADELGFTPLEDD